jgi:holo-[acyl-carrier protein] synthase
MTVWGIGVDVVDVPRFAASLERTPTLEARLFTPDERSAGLPMESLAARFAAKEALVKALRSPGGLSWQDVQVDIDPAGAPHLSTSGSAADRVDELGLSALHVSLSHDGDVATAFVVAEC